MKAVMWVVVAALMVSCATTAPQAIGLSADAELLEVLEKDAAIMADPAKAAIVAKVKADLKQADAHAVAVEKKLDQATEREIKDAHKAGAGDLVYKAGAFIIAAAFLFISYKILSKVGVL